MCCIESESIRSFEKNMSHLNMASIMVTFYEIKSKIDI